MKDYIAPPGFDFRYPSRFKAGKMYGSVHYLDIIVPRFNDELLKNLRCLQYLKEQGLMASAPRGCNETGIERVLTTKSTAILVPFCKNDREALKLKSDFIIKLCDLIAGGKNGLENDEKGIIDTCCNLSRTFSSLVLFLML